MSEPLKRLHMDPRKPEGSDWVEYRYNRRDIVGKVLKTFDEFEGSSLYIAQASYEGAPINAYRYVRGMGTEHLIPHVSERIVKAFQERQIF